VVVTNLYIDQLTKTETSLQKCNYTEAAERSPIDLHQKYSFQFSRLTSSCLDTLFKRMLIFLTDELFGMVDTHIGNHAHPNNGDSMILRNTSTHYQTTLCHNLENHYKNPQLCENLIFFARKYPGYIQGKNLSTRRANTNLTLCIFCSLREVDPAGRCYKT
jgi:hypothetical protein